MPSLDAAYASLVQAAYTIGMSDGIILALDHVPEWAQEAARQAMLADGSKAQASLAGRGDKLDEISALQTQIAAAIEADEAARN